MEGVGARLGRSSTRYGPATVFNGPVRKWKKKWVHVLPSNSNHSHSHSLHASANGNHASRLLLYKWTPISYSTNGINGDKNSGKDEAGEEAAASDEPPRRKFKYIPIAVLEDEENEAADYEAMDKVDGETKPSNTDPSAPKPTSKTDGLNEKPDINDVPAEESQDNNRMVRQDLNESTLDLSLG